MYCLTGLVLLRTAVPFRDTVTVRRNAEALATLFFDSVGARYAYTFLKLKRTDVAATIVYCRWPPTHDLYTSLAVWLDDATNTRVPPYSEPEAAAAPPDDALRDITDEAVGMAQLRRLYSEHTTIRCGPSDGRIAYVRIAPEAYRQYQQAMRLGAGVVPYEKLENILDWPEAAVLRVRGHMLHRFAEILFPDHRWTKPFRHDLSDGVHVNDVLIMRRTACVLHGSVLAGTNANDLFWSCNLTNPK